MPAVSWSEFWGPAVGAYSIPTQHPQRMKIKRAVSTEGMRVTAELFDTLIGAAAGGTALATHKQLERANPEIGSAGGARVTETITDINRATTAADVTSLKEMTTPIQTRPTTYPRDLSGNGGPAF